MPTPSPSWNTVRVYGTWRNHDGSKKAGKYTVTMPVRVTNATDDVIFPAGTFGDSLDTANNSQPSMSVQVPASDDPDNTPSGWQVTVNVTFTDGATPEKYTLSVPLASAGPGINLRTVVPDSPQIIPEPQVLVFNQVSGLAFVNHGADADVARPNAVTVIWAGTVEPVNADTDYDLWVGPEGA